MLKSMQTCPIWAGKQGPLLCFLNPRSLQHSLHDCLTNVASGGTNLSIYDLLPPQLRDVSLKLPSGADDAPPHVGQCGLDRAVDLEGEGGGRLQAGHLPRGINRGRGNRSSQTRKANTIWYSAYCLWSFQQLR